MCALQTPHTCLWLGRVWRDGHAPTQRPAPPTPASTVSPVSPWRGFSLPLPLPLISHSQLPCQVLRTCLSVSPAVHVRRSPGEFRPWEKPLAPPERPVSEWGRSGGCPPRHRCWALACYLLPPFRQSGPARQNPPPGLVNRRRTELRSETGTWCTWSGGLGLPCWENSPAVHPPPISSH